MKMSVPLLGGGKYQFIEISKQVKYTHFSLEVQNSLRIPRFIIPSLMEYMRWSTEWLHKLIRPWMAWIANFEAAAFQFTLT